MVAAATTRFICLPALNCWPGVFLLFFFLSNSNIIDQVSPFPKEGLLKHHPCPCWVNINIATLMLVYGVAPAQEVGPRCATRNMGRSISISTDINSSSSNTKPSNSRKISFVTFNSHLTNTKAKPNSPSFRRATCPCHRSCAVRPYIFIPSPSSKQVPIHEEKAKGEVIVTKITSPISIPSISTPAN